MSGPVWLPTEAAEPLPVEDLDSSAAHAQLLSLLGAAENPIRGFTGDAGKLREFFLGERDDVGRLLTGAEAV